jgi:hypothetical protein
MDEDLTWEVRCEAAGREAPAKAFFYWKKDGQLVRSAEFTQPELEVECERLSKAGGDITQFALALVALSNSGAETENVALVDQRRSA